MKGSGQQAGPGLRQQSFFCLQTYARNALLNDLPMPKPSASCAHMFMYETGLKEKLDVGLNCIGVYNFISSGATDESDKRLVYSNTRHLVTAGMRHRQSVSGGTRLASK